MEQATYRSEYNFTLVDSQTAAKERDRFNQQRGNTPSNVSPRQAFIDVECRNPQTNQQARARFIISENGINHGIGLDQHYSAQNPCSWLGTWPEPPLELVQNAREQVGLEPMKLAAGVGSKSSQSS